MHIPTHQIHNVLNAYAKRLKKLHDAANSDIAEKPEDQFNTYSAEEKRRLILNKISADIIDRIARSRPSPRIESKNALTNPSQPPSDPQTELIRYHILTKNGQKISATMMVPDADFLIKQLEEIARKSAEK